MKVFHSDLDNTLIYSYKHEIGRNKICVERYQDREISFMTEKSYHLLKEINDRILFVPTTTRTIEQYQRICLGVGTPSYALVCNGGVLLVHGEEDFTWYEESLRLVSDCQLQLEIAEKILKADENVNFEVRNIRMLFLFTKSENPIHTVELLQKMLDLSLVDVCSNGVKVYVVPKKLSKGRAVKRFREKVKAEWVIAAGDSEFDFSMLLEADMAFAPYDLSGQNLQGETIRFMRDGELFSNQLLKSIKNICSVQHMGQ